MSPSEESWYAYRKVVLERLDGLKSDNEKLEDEMHVIRDILIETVGRSGKNGRLGNLESRVKRSESASKARLLVTGTAGGGALVGIVELLKLFGS